MYKRGAQGWLKHLDFILLDLVCLYAAFVLAYGVRYGSFSFYEEEAYRSLAIVLFLSDLAVAILFSSFKNVLKRGLYREFAMTVKHVCLLEAVVIVYLFSVQESMTYSRLVIYLMGVFYFLLGYVSRQAWKKHLLRVMGSERAGSRSLLIVTVSRLAREAAGNVSLHNYEQFRLAGMAVLDRDMRGQKLANVPVTADADDVLECVCRGWIDEVLIYLPREETGYRELTEKFLEMGVTVHTVLYQALENKGQKQFVERIGSYTVLTNSINCATLTQQIIKRGIAGGLLGSLITCVLFLFLAPAIYILSPGPIFFKQERVGKGGKRFQMYKFRSMYPDAEERRKELEEKNRVKSGLMFKIEGDPRIIGSRVLPDGSVKKGFGNFIRDFSLDEFPQFFNVLKGDMSLVGTRPPTVDEWERYELHHRARLAIRPGITGLWQVNGRSGITDFEDVVKLDTRYITEWSMGLDFRILFKTVGAVFGKRGAM